MSVLECLLFSISAPFLVFLLAMVCDLVWTINREIHGKRWTKEDVKKWNEWMKMRGY